MAQRKTGTPPAQEEQQGLQEPPGKAAAPFVSVAIKSMGGHYASGGVGIESNRDGCCPPLAPGDIIEVPADHLHRLFGFRA